MVLYNDRVQNALPHWKGYSPTCSLMEYLHDEEEVPVYMDFDGVDWDVKYF